MKKRVLSMFLVVLMLAALLPTSAWAGSHGGGTQTYRHLEVKVDAEYEITVGDIKYQISGTVEQSTLKVFVGGDTQKGKEYSFESAGTKTEGSRTEYTLQNGVSLSSTDYQDSDYKISSGSFWIEADIVLSKEDITNQGLAGIMESHLKDGEYVVHYSGWYTGYNECTNGKDLRSEMTEEERASAGASGYDLYLRASETGVAITEGILAIEKKVVDENDAIIADDAGKFTFSVTGPDDYSETVEITGNDTETLTDLTPGLYTITEQPTEGYAVSGGAGAYTQTWQVEEKEDESIPIVSFTNTKLTEKGTLYIKKTSNIDGTYNVYVQENDDGQYRTADLSLVAGEPYVSKILEAGEYIISEPNAEKDGFDLTTTITVDGEAIEDGKITITAGKVTEVTVDNQYDEKKPETSPDPTPTEPTTPPDNPDNPTNPDNPPATKYHAKVVREYYTVTDGVREMDGSVPEERKSDKQDKLNAEDFKTAPSTYYNEQEYAFENASADSVDYAEETEEIPTLTLTYVRTVTTEQGGEDDPTPPTTTPPSDDDQGGEDDEGGKPTTTPPTDDDQGGEDDEGGKPTTTPPTDDDQGGEDDPTPPTTTPPTDDDQGGGDDEPGGNEPGGEDDPTDPDDKTDTETPNKPVIIVPTSPEPSPEPPTDDPTDPTVEIEDDPTDADKSGESGEDELVSIADEDTALGDLPDFGGADGEIDIFDEDTALGGKPEIDGADDAETVEIADEATATADAPESDPDAPKTGDGSAWWLGLMLLSAAGATTLLATRKREKNRG